MKPGWYPDPDDEGARRYWDGESWSAPLPIEAAPKDAGEAVPKASWQTLAEERGTAIIRACAVGPCQNARLPDSQYCSKHGPAGRRASGVRDAAPVPLLDQGLVPPGWFVDPLNSSLQRYWDGTAWTKQIRSPKNRPAAPWPAGIPRPDAPADVVAHNRKLNIILGSVAAAIVVAIIVAVALNSGGKAKGGGGGDSNASFAHKIEQNGRAMAQDTSALVVEVFAAADAGDDSALFTISHDASTLHDHLTDFRDDVLVGADLNDDGQSVVVDGQDEITKGVGTVIRWCDDPSPSLTDLWQSQLSKGIGEWNAGVRAVWKKAGLTGPPTIELPSG